MANDFIDLDINSLYANTFTDEYANTFSDDFTIRVLKQRISNESFAYHFDMEADIDEWGIHVRKDNVNLKVHNLIRDLLT